MPTVGVALADVCAESSYKSWVFDEIDSSEEAVRAVLRALRSEGYRYMRHIHDQGSIRLALEQRRMSRELLGFPGRYVWTSRRFYRGRSGAVKSARGGR